MPANELLREDFNYHLPTELIAQQPAAERSASRLLYLPHDGPPVDKYFVDFPQLLRPGDLLVFNNTRVIKARLYGRKSTGGRIECLIERVLDNDNRALAHLRASNPPKKGQELFFAQDSVRAQVGDKNAEGLTELKFSTPLLPLLERHGQLPLPPYIGHSPSDLDEKRYQTVFASEDGAVAAPTAALHFDEQLLQQLADSPLGLGQAFVTLHVGAGTFRPVRSERIAEHRMHAERFYVPQATITAVERTKKLGGRVIAIGTTSLRALESAALYLSSPTQHNTLEAQQLADGSVAADSRLFISPGYRFHWVDALLTNFHLPESTLLMLVSALAGRQRIRQAYAHAIKEHYRFFSYGDAMFIAA